jgi:hypothetical protein
MVAGLWRGRIQTTELIEIIALVEKLTPKGKLQLIECLARDLQRTPNHPCPGHRKRCVSWARTSEKVEMSIAALMH